MSEPARIWRYLGETRDGETVRGELAGRDEADALNQVRQLGVTPIDVSPARVSLAAFSGARARLSFAETEAFVRGLADLLEAGIGLAEAVNNLAQGEKRRVLRRFLERISARIMAGESLTAALSSDPAQPPNLLIGLARAGEETGDLGAVLRRYAEQIEAENEMRQNLIGQLVYPGALVGFIFATLLFLAYFVLPQFETVFTNANAIPPAQTAFVFAAGGFLRDFGIWLPAVLIAIAIAVQALAQTYPQVLDRVRLNLPVLGSLTRNGLSARYCGALGFLLASGAPMARAESVARATLDSALARTRLDAAAARLRAGTALSVALDGTQLFEPETVRLIVLGEKSGELAAMLSRAAQLSQSAQERFASRALDLIGPALTALLGLAVGAVILSVMSGVLSLNEVVF
ncbi:type II secretion system F family protein [Maricaulis sp.]|uniref:type II secretion system F family protein n=1 Tax=Maricaulis sp. TaxID=1486257 RepID=UPI00260CE93E|nr:type II secretion system F family protein [Maricaulis sp.]